MSKLRILSAADVRQALPMSEAIKGMKQAYSQLSSGQTCIPLRASVPVGHQSGTALFMPAYMKESRDLAIKVVSVFPKNGTLGVPIVSASVLVLNEETGQPVAMIEGSSLTGIRTGAGAGAATDVLALPDARVLAILGSGVQARAGLEAICTVRDIEEVRVYSPNPDHAARFAAEMEGLGPIPHDIQVVKNARSAVINADIIHAATTSSEPVFDGRDVKRGAHINGVGSYTPSMQEVDSYTMKQALIIVDSFDSVLAEAGDIIVPINNGDIDEEDIYAEIGEILSGDLDGRISDEQITFFKSVGVAAQDAVAARIALENAEELGLGTVVDF